MSMNESNANKFKALETLFQSVEKQFGKGTIMRLSDESKIAQELQVIPSGSVSLDVALGIGGLPKEELLKSMEQSQR